jgi:hypothetical protein
MMKGCGRSNGAFGDTVEKWDCANLNSSLATHTMSWVQGHII